MIVLLDTSTPTCRLTLVSDAARTEYEWEAARELAKGLLAFVEEKLADQSATWNDITSIGVYRGPGSFTGLRIGITVANSLAQGLNIPVVGSLGDEWHNDALSRLERGENDHVVLPEYGGEAHITAPRK